MNKTNTFGFTTSYGELYQKYGKPSRRHDHYTEAEIVTFGPSGQWIHYSNNGTCFKRAYDSFSAEETRLRLMRRHVRFTVKHNMADPSERLCNKYPTHNQEFDSDVVLSPDYLLNNKFEEVFA